MSTIPVDYRGRRLTLAERAEIRAAVTSLDALFEAWRDAGFVTGAHLESLRIGLTYYTEALTKSQLPTQCVEVTKQAMIGVLAASDEAWMLPPCCHRLLRNAPRR